MDQKSILYLRLVMGLVFGALAGAMTALLVAPRSGKETRQDLNQRGQALLGRANSALHVAQDKVETWLDVSAKPVFSQVSRKQDGGMDGEILAE